MNTQDERKKKLKINWLEECPKCKRNHVEVTTIKGSKELLFDGDKVNCWCGQTGEIETNNGEAWVEWDEVVISDEDNHDTYYRSKYPDFWERLHACNHQACEHYEVSLHAWLVALKHGKEKLEGCVVVPETEFDELKAKLSKYDNKLYFSHDANSGGFQYHTTLEGAKAEAESNLDWYRDRVADGHHVADDGDFAEVCYGIALATADYNIDDVVTKEHHENNEWTKYEVGTEILSLNLYEEVVEAARGGNEEK